jgi:hypothetical protein
MSILDIFSKRQKRLRGDVPDVYAYDSLPGRLKVQIIHIWRETLGDDDDINRYIQPTKAYKYIVDGLRKEYGLFALVKAEQSDNSLVELSNFLIQERDVEKCLDAVELSFQVIDRLTRDRAYLRRDDSSLHADGAIDELNKRFREHGLGYEFVDGQIVRVDSSFLHAESVKPALSLLGRQNTRARKLNS